MAKKKSITETGPKPLRGVRNPDLYSSTKLDVDPILQEELDQLTSQATYNYYNARHGNIGYNPEDVDKMIEPTHSDLDYGSSTYDDVPIIGANPQDIQNRRGERQPGALQLLNGVLKGGVLAATTFMDGTIGLGVGIGTAIMENRFSGLWDNPFSKAMKSVQDLSEEYLPNYYTVDEQNTPFNIFSANFWGDKFIKNLGFSVGAFATAAVGGGVLGAVLKAAKVAAGVGKVAVSGVGIGLSALNEGRVEALNNSTEAVAAIKENLYNEHLQNLGAIKQQYGNTEMYNQLVAAEKERFTSAFNKTEEQRAKIGNADLIMNLPILALSNYIQFAKVFTRGYKAAKTAQKAASTEAKTAEAAEAEIKAIAGMGKQTGRTTAKVSGSLAEGTLEGPSRAAKAWAAIKGALSEGAEEMNQGIAADIAGSKYENDVLTYYRDGTDPDSLNTLNSWATATREAIVRNLGDPSAWEEFTIGAITGLLGIPIVKKVNGKYKFTLEGGIYNHIKDFQEEKAKADEVANYFNSKVNTEEYRNYYKGLTRHIATDKKKEEAAAKGDKFEFENAEHAQMVSDIEMASRAGKLEEWVDMIKDFTSISDEDLESIIASTSHTTTEETKEGETTKAEGPYINADGSPVTSNPLTKEEAREQIQKKATELLQQIDEYVKTANSISEQTREKLTLDQLSELIYMNSAIDNWGKRNAQMRIPVKNAITRLRAYVDHLIEIKKKELQQEKGITEKYEAIEETIKKLEEHSLNFSTLENSVLDDASFMSFLASLTEESYDGYINTLEKFKDVANFNYFRSTKEGVPEGDTTFEDALQAFKDAKKASMSIIEYRKKLDEYLKEPTKLDRDKDAIDKEVEERETNKQATELSDKLKGAQNLDEFANIFNEDTQGDEAKEKVLNSIDSPYKEEFQKMLNTKRAIAQGIENEDWEEGEKDAAVGIWKRLTSEAGSLDNMLDEESLKAVTQEYANNEGGNIPIETLQSAAYKVGKIINGLKANNNFGDKFDNGPKFQPANETQSPTQPTIKEQHPQDNTEDNEIPPAELTDEDLFNDAVEQDKESSSSAEEEAKGKREYWNPTISEIHSTATINRDYRPMNVVAAQVEGLNFDTIYNYLASNGAFDYLNKGKLKAGDMIKFMIDPSYEEKAKKQSWYKGPTIFMTTAEGQVVGELPISKSQIDKYEHLQDFRNKVIEEYEARENKESIDKFFSTKFFTHVSKIMKGKVQYSNSVINLRNVPGVPENLNDIKLAVADNQGILITNDSNLKIEQNTGTKYKKGVTYILMPTGRGTYTPIAAKSKHFNSTEIDLNSGTDMVNDLKSIISRIVISENNLDLGAALSELRTKLYLPTSKAVFAYYNNNYGTGIVITADGKDIRIPFTKKSGLTSTGETLVFNDDGTTSLVKEAPRSNITIVPIEERFQQLVAVLMEFNAPIQVSVSEINIGTYNKKLIESGILETNLSAWGIVGNWFTVNPINNEGKEVNAVNPKGKAAVITQQPVNNSQETSKGIEVVFPGITYEVDLLNNKIYDKASGEELHLDAETTTIVMTYAQYQEQGITTGIVESKQVPGVYINLDTYSIAEKPSGPKREYKSIASLVQREEDIPVQLYIWPTNVMNVRFGCAVMDSEWGDNINFRAHGAQGWGSNKNYTYLVTAIQGKPIVFYFKPGFVTDTNRKSIENLVSQIVTTPNININSSPQELLNTLSNIINYLVSQDNNFIESANYYVNREGIAYLTRQDGSSVLAVLSYGYSPGSSPLDYLVNKSGGYFNYMLPGDGRVLGFYNGDQTYFVELGTTADPLDKIAENFDKNNPNKPAENNRTTKEVEPEESTNPTTSRVDNNVVGSTNLFDSDEDIFEESYAEMSSATEDNRLRNLVEGIEERSGEEVVLGLMNIIEKNPKTKIFKEVLSKVLGKDFFKKLNVRVINPYAMAHMYDSYKFKSFAFSGRRAYYNAKDHTIYINAVANYNEGDAANVILHEIMHAVTVDRLKSNPDMRAKFENLIDEFLKKNSQWFYKYGNSMLNTHRVEEFLADMWADPRLIRDLQATPSQNTTIFAKIKEIIGKILTEVFGGRTKSSMFGEASTYMIDLLERDFTPTNEDATFYEGFNSYLQLEQDCKEFLHNFAIDIKEIQNYDSNVPLFDALYRSINPRSHEDIPDAVGQAIAFMMQYDPKMETLMIAHLRGETPVELKGLRRSIAKRGEVNLRKTKSDNKLLNRRVSNTREEAVKAIGKDIANELRVLYKIKPKGERNDYTRELNRVIEAYQDKMDTYHRYLLESMFSYTQYIAQLVSLNDPTLILNSRKKPGSEKIGYRVALEEAFENFPEEANIVSKLNKYDIALGGSASIAAAGRLMRPIENPLHDLDFNAEGKNKESLQKILDKEFPYNTHYGTINNKDGNVTETFIVLNQPFDIRKTGNKTGVVLDKKGNQIGYYANWELHLNPGIQGKFLDFFTGPSSGRFVPINYSFGNKQYLISSPLIALAVKVDWQRDKDIWDYNRYVPNGYEIKSNVTPNEVLKDKINKATVIWGHPALGKTTFMRLLGDNVIEWDDEVAAAKREFVRDIIDPEHKMPNNEFYKARAAYEHNWRQHPEFIKFMQNAWNKLVARAKAENKKLMASPMSLIQIGAKDIDLYITLGYKDFMQRNIGRGNTAIDSFMWKNSIDAELLNAPKDKVYLTNAYLSDIMAEHNAFRELSSELQEALNRKGVDEALFNIMSREECDELLNCIGF
jgi:hypothetical protein